MVYTYASIVLSKQVNNRHGCSTKGISGKMTIDPQNVSLGWTPVTKRTVGRKRVAKKGQVHHKYIPSVSFQVDEEVVPPLPGLTKMCSPKKKRVIRGKKSHKGSKKTRKRTDARDKTELDDIFIDVEKKMKTPNNKPKKYVRRVSK